MCIRDSNCTDDTEAVAAGRGARIFRPEGVIRSKGEVLTQVVDKIVLAEEFDAMCVFDAEDVYKRQGLVMSLPSTISSFAMMSWPDTTESSPACAARIFCVIVIPIVLLLPPVLCFLDGCFRQIKTVRSAGAIRDC